MSIYNTARGTIIISGAHPLLTDISYSLLCQKDNWKVHEQPISLTHFQVPTRTFIQREFLALNAITMTDYHVRNLRTDSPANLNRYSDIIPYSHSNVTLNAAPSYINANWISGIEFPL